MKDQQSTTQEGETPRTDENRFRLSGLDYEARYNGMLANAEAIEKELTTMTARCRKLNSELEISFKHNEELTARAERSVQDHKNALTSYRIANQEIEQLRAQLEVANKALNYISCWGEGKDVGPPFDEPHAAKIARKALAAQKEQG